MNKHVSEVIEVKAYRDIGTCGTAQQGLENEGIWELPAPLLSTHTTLWLLLRIYLYFVNAFTKNTLREIEEEIYLDQHFS